MRNSRKKPPASSERMRPRTLASSCSTKFSCLGGAAGAGFCSSSVAMKRLLVRGPSPIIDGKDALPQQVSHRREVRGKTGTTLTPRLSPFGQLRSDAFEQLLQAARTEHG